MNLYVCISINIIFLISLPTSPYSFEMNLFNVLANFSMLCIFLVLCRSYLWVFHLFHTIFVSLAGFPLLDAIPDSGYFYMGYAFSLPPFILILSGNVKLASFAGLVQFYLSLTKFKLKFTQMIRVEDPELFADKFVNANTFLFMIGLFGSLFLLRTLDRRTLELLKAKKTTESTLEQQKTFILSFSHELRNPINSLLGNLQLVLQGEALSQKARDMINIAKVCGDILLHGINNVLDTGKHEIGKLEVNPVPTKLHELFQRTWGIYSELLRQKRLKGQLKIEKSTPPMVKIDSHKVNQILLNLIGNAVKFTEKGSVTVTIKWLKSTKVSGKCFEPVPYDDVDEGLFEKEDNLSTVNSGKFTESFSGSFMVLNETKRQFSYDEVMSPDQEVEGVLKIVVKDTGSGMKKEALEKLFQKFSQVSENISQRQIGTGLGLYITKEICRAMDGEIKAYSRPGAGTTFIVCLPAIALPLNQMARTNSRVILEKLTDRRIKALVADDSPFNVSLTCDYLSKFGASVASVAYIWV